MTWKFVKSSKLENEDVIMIFIACMCVTDIYRLILSSFFTCVFEAPYFVQEIYGSFNDFVERNWIKHCFVFFVSNS